MLPLHTKQDIDELKSFGLTMAWIFPAVFMGLLPWLFERAIPWWPAYFSGLLILLYVVYPKGLYYPYRAWMAIASVLGWINTRIVLAIAFYLLITPIGWVMRSLHKLQYRAKPKAVKSTYWHQSEKEKQPERLKDPF